MQPTHILIVDDDDLLRRSLAFNLENAGYRVLSGPRTTGDGYYESVVSDPENNLVEITI